MNKNLPEEEYSTGGISDIDFEDNPSRRIVFETTEYLKRQAKHLSDGNITDQRVSQTLQHICSKQNIYLQ